MLLQRKAAYNLLQINLPRIESGELKIDDLQPWQTENYREKSTDALLERLGKLGIGFGTADFASYAEEFEEPEELLDALACDREQLEQDQVFLLIFELWRRHFPEKRTLSIFCDELDYQLTQHDLGNESDIIDMLAYFQQVLDENVDKGLDPQQTFETIQTYCANDLESFLFDYTLEAIEEGDATYAEELLDGYSRYVKDGIWFDYLRARVEYHNDPEEGCIHLERIIEDVNSETSIELVEEMLYFLADTGNHTLFYDLALKMFPMMQEEGDLHEFLEICYLHYDHLELKEPAVAISELFHNRKTRAREEKLDPNDPDLAKLHTILDQRLSL